MKHITLLVCAAGLAFAQGAGAQSSTDLSGQWETRIGAVFQNSGSTDFDGGTKVDFKSGTGFKFGLGYHLDDNLEVGGTFSWNQIDYDAKVAGQAGLVYPIKGTVDTSTLLFDATWNFGSGPLRPFVTGSLGYSWVDTNIATQPPQTGCWWDPWWGYICTTWQDTKTLDGFAYGLGVGARYDFNRQFALSASYRMTWIQLDNAKGTPDFDGFDLSLGWKF